MTDDVFYIHDDDSTGKARIMREGLRLFAENGLSATSIRDIASATGMTNPALYKHFKTKHDLALVLFDRLYREHLKRLTVATQRPSDFPGKFRAFITTYLSSYDEHPHATIFTADNLVTLWPDVSQEFKNRTAVSLLRDVLKHGRAEGSVSSDQDLDLQLAMILGTLGQVTRQMYFRTLTGPASIHATGIERILRAGLS